MKQARLFWLPLCVLVVSLGVSWLAWHHERALSRAALRTQFDFALRDVVSRIEQRMVTYEQVMRGVQSFATIDGIFDSDRFRRYIADLRLDANFSDVRAIGIAQWVPGSAVDAHVAAMKKRGVAQYGIYPVGDRDGYAPIIQRELYYQHEHKLLGFDPWSEPVRRLAMEKARDSGLVAMASGVALAFAAQTDGKSGFIMYLPIYQRDQPLDSVAQRRAHLVGWTYATFRIQDLMANLYSQQPSDLALAIFDGVDTKVAERLYATPNYAAPTPAHIMVANEYLTIAGHTWLLSLGATDKFHARSGGSAESFVAMAGIGLSLLMTVLTWLMVTGRSRAVRLANGMTRELSASEEKFRAIADCTVNWEVWWGLDGRPRWINPSVYEYTGYTVAECMAMEDFGKTVIHADDMPRVALEMRKALQGCRGKDLEFRCVRKNGSVFWLSMSWVPIQNADGEFAGFRTSGRDITERKQAEAELRIAAVAFDAQEAMMVTDARGIILRINAAFTQSTGYTASDVVGQTPQLLRSHRHDAAFYKTMWDTVHRTGAWQGEVWDRRKNGEVYPKWLMISAVKGADDKVTHYIGAHHDITERKAAAEKIEELAFYDALTGLPNRTLLLDRLQQSITAGNLNRTYSALLFIDLDQFKTLNDTMGHDKGDLLLQHVAKRLTTSVRQGDTVARLGGDEFVVILERLGADRQEASMETRCIGEKMLAALNQVYEFGDIDYRSTASIGATLFHGPQTSVDALLRHADLAMYKAKETGRNALRFFDPAMQTDVMERAALETALRRAIIENQLVLHFQPQLVGAHCVTGAEALIRWMHPERGLLSPDAFIGIAEDTGMILALGHWVMRCACTQLAQWATHADMAHLTLAVNVSARQFREPDFVSMVLAVLHETGANPHLLKLELTESLLVDNLADVIAKMKALKSTGVHLSLDDFGTGYSSFSYLKQLPLDQLKIDQSFVRDVLHDANDAAIAVAIVTLAQRMNMAVMAEGVESQAQWDFLVASGCEAFQGNFFSPPLPIDQFELFLRKSNHAAPTVPVSQTDLRSLSMT